jgi:hypothetical protein
LAREHDVFIFYSWAWDWRQQPGSPAPRQWRLCPCYH